MFQFPSFATDGLCIQPKVNGILLPLGFPIRRSRDQRLLAAPPGLSQLTTSFIASCRQGIHRVPVVA